MTRQGLAVSAEHTAILALFLLVCLGLPWMRSSHFEKTPQQPAFRTLNRRKYKNTTLELAKRSASLKYAARKKVIQEACLSFKNASILEQQFDQKRKGWWLVPDQKILYCMIKKVASTTWKKKLYSMSRRGHRLKTFSGTSMNESLTENNLVFTFVRHPVARLKSSYLQFMVFKNWTKSINRKFRDLVVKHVLGIDPHQDHHTNPTISEFLQYLILTREENGLFGMNIHFVPQWLSCPFCNVDFDVIGNLETYQEDYNFAMKALNLKVPNSHINKRNEKIEGDFFDNVSEALTAQIYNLYKEDFLFFGYEYPEELG